MQCPEFETRLQAALDERRDPADDGPLAAHAMYCGPCSELLAGQRAILRTMSRLKRMRAASQRRASFHFPYASALKPLLAVAAAMLLALGLVWQLRSHSSRFERSSGRSFHVGRGPGSLAIAARGQSSPRKPASSSSHWLIEAPRIPQHLRACGARLDQLAVSLPAVIQQLETNDHYAPGLSSLRASLGFVWETLVGPLRPAPVTGPDASEKRQTSGRGTIVAALA